MVVEMPIACAIASVSKKGDSSTVHIANIEKMLLLLWAAQLSGPCLSLH